MVIRGSVLLRSMARLSHSAIPGRFSTHSNEARVGNEKKVKNSGILANDGDWQIVKIFPATATIFAVRVRIDRVKP